jgi:DNA-binding NarL/FixJ family response regulator
MNEVELPSDRKKLLGRDLSPRETEVLLSLAGGETNSQIAQKMSISVKTVEAHRARIFEKLGAVNAPQAIVLSFQRGMFRTPLSFYSTEELTTELATRQTT